MKKILPFSALLLLVKLSFAQCPTPTISGNTVVCQGTSTTLSTTVTGNSWAQKTDFGGNGRFYAVGFSIGTKGYIGTGQSSTGYLSDFWEYDSVTETWTQKANYGGGLRSWAVGLSIGTKGYIGTGMDNSNSGVKDFWEYDPSLNTWTKKADFGGVGRSMATAFSVGNKGYIGTGYDNANNVLKDFWEYDQTANTWTRKADFGGQERSGAVGFGIGNKGYLGTGRNGSVYKNDFWEYDPSGDTWTAKANVGTKTRANAVGFSIGNKGFIGTGYSNTANYPNDLLQYDQATDTWTTKVNIGGVPRSAATGFSIGNKGYIGTGGYSITYDKGFWEYTPSNTYQWAPGGETTASITTATGGNYTVTVTNAFGCSATSAVTTVISNTPPTDISLSANSAAENLVIGTVIGDFSTTNADNSAGQTFTYALVAGTGDTGNAQFSIVGNQLKTNAVFNYEAINSYTIRVRTTDGCTGQYEKIFTINIADVNDAPVITSNGGGATAAISINENTTAVTTVTATDEDAGSILTYSLNGGANAAKFTINSSTGELKFITAPAYVNGNNTFVVVVRVSDGISTADQTITVTVKGNQVFTFPVFTNKSINSVDFLPGATVNTGLPLTYSSSNTAVATVYQDALDGNKWKIHIVAGGTSDITAVQAGNANYIAGSLMRTLTVNQPLVLDQVGLTTATPAALAFSLRKLSGTYTGPAIKVRQSNTGAEANVDFDNNNAVSEQSIITITAKGTSVFTVGQTMTFASFYTTQNITVTTWYDQSGSAMNITQATTSLQPVIVTAGTMNRLKNKPVIYFGTANLASTAEVIFSAGASMVGVAKGNGTIPSSLVTKTNSNQPAPFDYTNTAGDFYTGNGTGSNAASNLSSTSTRSDISSFVQQSVYSFTMPTSGNYFNYLNGALTASGTINGFLDRGTKLMMGNRNDNNGSGNFYTSEVILFNAVLSDADRNTIENNQKSIYLSNNADLANLILSDATITGFSGATTAYSTSVNNSIISTTVTPTLSNLNATVAVRINGGTYAAVVSGSPSASLPLNIGSNTVDVKVTAQDGTTIKTYTVNITRDKRDQTITFSTFGAKTTNDADFEPGATTTSNLALTYTSSNTAVAEVYQDAGDNNKWKIKIKGVGATDITALQAGDATYNSASLVRALQVTDATLPVSVSTYTASINNGAAKLQWQTITEINNKGFVVYRSGDDQVFRPIGELAGAGDASTLKNYTFYDRSPIAGNNYYRLIQVDKDGKQTSLGERVLSFKLAVKDIKVYPNPTTDKVSIEFEAGNYSLLELIDYSGKVLEKWNVNTQETVLVLSLSKYPAAGYLLRLTGKQVMVKKVIKL